MRQPGQQHLSAFIRIWLRSIGRQVERLRALLAGSWLWGSTLPPREPISFRSAA
jgi:hypothetical protein